MELDVAAAEESNFEYLPFSRTAISFDYPATSSTGSNISRLNAANLQGPANLTAVLTGDEIAVSVQSWYANNGDNTSLTELEDIVAAMLSGLLTQGAGIVDETTLIGYAGSGGTGSAPLSIFLDSLLDAADMSLPQGFLIYVFFDEFLNINSQYSGMIQVGEPGALEMLQSQAISIPANGYFYTFLTNYSDNLVSFDNLTIRRKNGVVRSIKEYYPYGLEYGRFNGSFAYNAIEMYNKGYSSSTWHELEWKYEGLDLNYFAARYYDPILGRWHAPDPLEQCHSPYLAMLGDPANFLDPDGRAGIPFLQDFMKSDGGFILESLAQTVGLVGIGAGYAALVNNLGGIISTAVSIGTAVYSASSSVKSLSGFSAQPGNRTFGHYDFSAEFTMMKSSRHAGMTFDGATNENNGDPEPNLGQVTIFYAVSYSDDGTRSFWKYTLTVEINNPDSGDEEAPIGNLVVDEVADIPVGEVAQMHSDPNDPTATFSLLSIYPRIDPLEEASLGAHIESWLYGGIRTIDGVGYDKAGYPVFNINKSMVFEFGADRGAGKGRKLMKLLCSKKDVLKPKSINQLNTMKVRGQLPRGIERFDKGRGTVNLPHDEVTFGDGSSLYRTGDWRHHYGHVLTNEQIQFLQQNGWTIPK